MKRAIGDTPAHAVPHTIMPTVKQHQNMYIQINLPLTGEWKVDQATVKEIAETPTTAAQIGELPQVILALFNRLTHGTPSEPNYPERSGLARKVHDELFPIAHFARLHFDASRNVSISWHLGNQNFDATIEDQRADPKRSSIRYLEVTTLQDWDDAKMLQRLSKEESITIESDQGQASHLQKVDLLRKALQNKGMKVYPPDTALLVYTDEDRFAQFSFGMPPCVIDKKNSFGAVLDEMIHLLGHFSEIFVYSKKEIYCARQLRTK